MIQFLLNQETVCLQQQQADLTVLDYLRQHRGLTGSKEGCASGDCGACTAVVVQPDRTGHCGLQYKHINTCITFIGSLHGKQLITVEHLKQSGVLHAVQQAMVNQHGTQCGFCTPGFVMSMFSLYKQVSSESHPHSAIAEFLAGNLCRCTGYKPIVNATIEATKNRQPDQFDKNSAQTLSRLNEINLGSNSDSNLDSNPGSTHFHLPKTCDQLAKLLRNLNNPSILAGGTDLALQVTQHLHPIDEIIGINQIEELHEIHITSQGFEVGAAVTLTTLHDFIKADLPSLSKLLQRFGSRQIRNSATLAGNIANASPIGDLSPVLLVLDAGINLQSDSGKRTINANDFFLDYKKTAMKGDEFIRSISLPKIKPATHFDIYKVSKRLDDDISAVCMAISIDIVDHKVIAVQIAFGGMSGIPQRAKHCEALLRGKIFCEASVVAAQNALHDDFEPIDDVRASAKYRMDVAKNLLNRLYFDITQPAMQTRINAHV